MAHCYQGSFDKNLKLSTCVTDYQVQKTRTHKQNKMVNVSSSFKALLVVSQGGSSTEIE